jgi:hypothetical protein
LQRHDLHHSILMVIQKVLLKNTMRWWQDRETWRCGGEVITFF